MNTIMIVSMYHQIVNAMIRVKHHFLLLEILIGLALLTACLFPLIHIPLNAVRSEITHAERIEMRRIADLTCVEWEAKLFAHEIPWKTFCCDKSKKNLLRTRTVVLGNKKFKEECFIWSARKKKGNNGEKYRLLTLEVHLNPLSEKSNSPFFFRHQILVTRTSIKEGQ